MSTGKVLLGVLAGVAAGATLGILFAPDSGVNTRRKISRKGQDYADGLKNQFNKLADSIGDEFDMLQDEAKQLSMDGKSKMQEIKKDMVDAIS